MYNCDIRVPTRKNALFYFLFRASCRHRIGLRDKVCRDTGMQSSARVLWHFGICTAERYRLWWHKCSADESHKLWVQPTAFAQICMHGGLYLRRRWGTKSAEKASCFCDSKCVRLRVSRRRSLIFILHLSAHFPPLMAPVSRVECTAPQKFVQYSEACDSDIVLTTAGGGAGSKNI